MKSTSWRGGGLGAQVVPELHIVFLLVLLLLLIVMSTDVALLNVSLCV